MIKKYKIILSVLLGVLILVSAVTVTGVLDINRMVREKEEKESPELVAAYTDIFTTYTDENSPLLGTDVENVYYAMDKDGGVRFYRAENGQLSSVAEKGTKKIKVTCSDQKLPAVIHYIEEGGKTIGYGLFTNKLYEGVYLYDFAFFKMTDMFPSFNSNGSRKLLVADIDKERFYSQDKVYSEIFCLYGDDTADYFLSENQRTVDIKARMRSDYKMFTDDILSQPSGKVLFFSSRYYTSYEESGMLDIITSGGYGENVDNEQYVENIASMNMWRTEKGVYYFRNRDEGGFTLKFFNGSKTEKIREFDGVLADDYLICGDYILNKLSGEIYGILTDKTAQLDYSAFKKDFAPSIFRISDNGRYCIFRGSNNRNKPVFGLADLETGEKKSYSDDIFGYVASMNVQNDGTMIVSLATGTSASSYYQIIGQIGNTPEG